MVNSIAPHPGLLSCNVAVANGKLGPGSQIKPHAITLLSRNQDPQPKYVDHINICCTKCITPSPRPQFPYQECRSKVHYLKYLDETGGGADYWTLHGPGLSTECVANDERFYQGANPGSPICREYGIIL